MSRSAFAARFTQLVDEPAMGYLTRWRMQLAQHALETEGATAAELATRLGYQSEAAFARAFKRVTGLPPAPPNAAANRSRPPPSRSLPPAKRVFPTCGWFLLLALLVGMIRDHDSHRRPRA